MFREMCRRKIFKVNIDKNKIIAVFRYERYDVDVVLKGKRIEKVINSDI